MKVSFLFITRREWSKYNLLIMVIFKPHSYFYLNKSLLFIVQNYRKTPLWTKINHWAFPRRDICRCKNYRELCRLIVQFDLFSEIIYLPREHTNDMSFSISMFFLLYFSLCRVFIIVAGYHIQQIPFYKWTRTIFTSFD